MKAISLPAGRKRFLLVLPLIVCPFLVLIFWLLGGDLGGNQNGDEVAGAKSGLNTALPDAKVEPISVLDKLSFYALAKKDSIRRREMEEMDPLYAKENPNDGWEKDVYIKPSQLYTPVYNKKSTQSSAEIAALEEMVQQLQEPKKDTDMIVLQQTLEQLLALQVPKKEIQTEKKEIPLFKERYSASKSMSGFYGESNVSEDSSINLFKAVVHGEQVVQHGSVIKLRLLHNVVIQQTQIPAGTFLFGMAFINQERLSIHIGSISFQHQLLPVELIVFDLDGMEGIHIPGSAGREVIRQSADQAVQSIGNIGIGASISSRLASAGLGSLKSLAGQRARMVKVTLGSGYQVFLADNKRREL